MCRDATEQVDGQGVCFPEHPEPQAHPSVPIPETGSPAIAWLDVT